MTPERHQQIIDVFQQALEIGLYERQKFVAHMCGADLELRNEVETLLTADRQSDLFLESPPGEVAATLLDTRHGRSFIGQHLNEYEVIELLGEGGMGEVFLAEDRLLGRRVALKVLAEEYALDAIHLRRAEEEARAIAALNHPNIVTIYAVGQTGSVHFLATEFVEGKTLRTLINAGPVSPEIVLQIANQAGTALAAAHAAGIVHRDIKPENMILRSDGLLKILDFGLAKRTGPPLVRDSVVEVMTAPGLILGTPRYMSPEQARGLDVDARSDIFSLGCLLYELVAGRPAIPGDTPADVIAAILTHQPESLTILQPNCPSALVRAIERAMEKDRDKRYASVEEMMRDLHSVENHASRLHPGHRKAAIAVLAALAVMILAAVTTWFHPGSRSDSIQSIAILPFSNGGGPNLELLADGLTDSLIDDLSQVPNLKVISRNSVFRYKGRQVDPGLTGTLLKAQAVLLGRISQRADRLVIGLELVDARDNRRLWGEQYDRLQGDLVQLQGEISKEILTKLRITLGRETEGNLAKRQRVSAEAYQFYLKGHFYLFRGLDENDLNTAIAYFNRALDKDPSYTRAALGMADSYVALSDYISPNEAMPKAREYALRALALGDSPSEAHVALGLVKLIYDWDWLAAEREFKYNSRLNPNSLETFSCLLHYEATLGRTNEAIASITELIVGDPMSVRKNHELGCASYFARKYDKALAQYRRTIALEPGLQIAYVIGGRSYVQKQLYSEAIAALKKGSSIDPEFPLIVAETAYAAAASGNRVAARAALDQLERIALHRYVDAVLLAPIYVALAEPDKAFFYLEKGYRERSCSMPWLKVEPKFDPLRSDPRYLDLLRRVGFAT